MSLSSRMLADSIAAGEGAFWLSCLWAAVYCVETGRYGPIIGAMVIACIAVAICFLYRPAATRMGRYRVRRSRTEMWWQLLVIPMLLAPVIGIALESLLSDVTGGIKLWLVTWLCTAGWAYYVIMSIVKRTFQRVRKGTRASKTR
ncbi:hypothetical protein SAMN05661010_01269 [Modicisalibacter muralis]|uniref:Uncharacterized protein n=1 Tax=Modicisalibacter muralis TaxID=119000 RepID=A0A1G9INK3_9GAMM|nr:hypothetical protein [Halomonas muralis]SDL26710.1 hypothetical protein SAMN05661010_01269 [Halomonas muralis]